VTRFSFCIAATVGAGRTGVVAMQRGEIRTPAFMPVGTAATVKAMRPEEMRASGADIILGNTYHLMLRPGAERIAKLGGLHKFMGWERPILTDSGGYQVMSLSELTKVTEEGVTFASHLDGSRHMLSPERSIEVQRLLGSDIVMQFDQLVPATASPEAQREAMERSIRWARRSKQEFEHGSEHASRSALFGIQQGALDQWLRKASSEALIDIGFDGYAVGGLAVGEGQDAMLGCLDFAVEMLPADKPRYLMGVGKPDDIVEAVLRGIDMFDCVLPTRSGRTGQAFTADGPLNLRNARFGEDEEPIEPSCPCPACTSFSRAYVHHLVKSGEILGAMLMTQHNLWFYQRLMQGLRDAIAEQRLRTFAGEFVALVELLGGIAAELVDDAPALHGRPRVDLLRPAYHMLILVRRQELVGAGVGATERDARVPWPDRHVGDAVVSARDIFILRQPLVEHIELAFHLHGVAIDGIFEFLGRIDEEMAESAAKEGRAAHLPEEP
jgi:queuine tRNA-ribosyltransferase